MISFKPTDDELAFINVAKEFSKGKIRTDARSFEENKTLSKSFRKSVEELGFSSLELPAAWGGLELPLLSQVQILEALSAGDLDVIQGLPGMNEATSFFRLLTEHQLLATIKQRFTNGDKPTVAFLHVKQSYDLPSIKSENGGWILNGLSQPIRLANEAEYVIVSGTDDAGQDIIAVLDAEESIEVVSGDYRLGLLCSGFARFKFNNTYVSSNSVLARGNEATTLLNEVVSRSRILEAAKEVGLMNSALEYATQYAAERRAFGDVIAKFQGVSFTLAQMSIKTQVSRNLTRYAASQFDNRAEDKYLLSKNALGNAHRSLRYVTDHAVQLLGGHGYVQEHPVEKWMRDAQTQIIYYETENELITGSGEEIRAGSDSYRFI